MLDLESAIKHCEELAEKNEEECKNWTYGASQINDDENRKKQFQKHAEWWHERAKEHRQLAEWLRELKRYKELFDERHGRIIDESQIKYVYYHEESVMLKDLQLKNIVLDHTDAPTILEANPRGESSVEKDDMVTTECKMTNRDIAKLFHEKYPDVRIQDYRYLCHEMFTNDLSGITLWLENGDVIEYYPKEGNQNDCIQATKQDISEKL